MSTEEDTIRRLKQIPYKEMLRLLTLWRLNRIDGRTSTQFLNEHNWTVDEWRIAICTDL